MPMNADHARQVIIQAKPHECWHVSVQGTWSVFMIFMAVLIMT